MEPHFEDQNMRRITYAEVREAMKGEAYPMSIVGEEIDVVMQVVNQGIDAHLEACFCPDRGDKFEHGERRAGKVLVTRTLECVVSPESMPVLLRRLFESGEERGESLASCILDTLQ